MTMTNKQLKLARKQRVAKWLPAGEQGPYTVSRFEITPEGADVYNAKMQEHPDGWARTRVVYPGRHTGLYEFGKSTDPWMSDTPAEVLDHYNVMMEMRKRGGLVLINGLGLGMIAAYALRLPNVTHVDVVELQTDIISLVGPHLPNQDKLTIHHANAYDITWTDIERWSVAWHDIWPTISADNLPSMDRLEEKYRGRVDYQETWVRAQCEQAAELDEYELAALRREQAKAQVYGRYVPATDEAQYQYDEIHRLAKLWKCSTRAVAEAAQEYAETGSSATLERLAGASTP